MIIANPIYDLVFKRLMQNEKIAKFFISTLTEQEIESLTLQPQEFIYSDELIGTRLFRMDFVATVKTDEGYKKVLIEVQKAFEYVDLMRFRNYLAEHYKKEDVVDGKNIALPITTIYVLGFNIPEIESACFKAERIYKDLLTKEIIPKKSGFVERLTHDSYIVQVNRIKGKYQTRLEKLLSLFEQSNFIDKEGTVKNYPYTVDTEELKLMTDILEYTASDPEAKKRMEIELEAWRSIEALTGGLREKLSIKELELEQEKQRAEKEKQRAEQLEQEKIDMIKEMIADGIPIEKIIKLTKIDKEFLKKHRLL
jgi:hypothetical protein